MSNSLNRGEDWKAVHKVTNRVSVLVYLHFSFQLTVCNLSWHFILVWIRLSKKQMIQMHQHHANVRVSLTWKLCSERMWNGFHHHGDSQNFPCISQRGRQSHSSLWHQLVIKRCCCCCVCSCRATRGKQRLLRRSTWKPWPPTEPVWFPR